MTTLPAAGTVRLNGTAVTAGQYVSAANIGSGLLVFHPAANGNGTPYTSFTFQVQDNGGTANGGTDLDASPNTLTFNVTAVNDSPVSTIPGSQSTTLNTARVFSTANSNALSVGDSDAAPAHPTAGDQHQRQGDAVDRHRADLHGGANGTATMTFTGTQTAINTALNGLTSRATTGNSGAASGRLISSDPREHRCQWGESDDVTVAITVKLTYSATISATTGPVNQYRLAETSGHRYRRQHGHQHRGLSPAASTGRRDLRHAGSTSTRPPIREPSLVRCRTTSRSSSGSSRRRHRNRCRRDKGRWLRRSTCRAMAPAVHVQQRRRRASFAGTVIAGPATSRSSPRRATTRTTSGTSVVFTREQGDPRRLVHRRGCRVSGVDNNTASLTLGGHHLVKISSDTDRNYAFCRAGQVALYNTDLSREHPSARTTTTPAESRAAPVGGWQWKRPSGRSRTAGTGAAAGCCRPRTPRRTPSRRRPASG